jgi:demethylmenaquinone methyltransferase/2-methoxy-6-polyprenyl-1,4-benzoquinol methylase
MDSAEELRQYYAARASVYDETAGYTDPESERLRGPIKARMREIFRGLDVLEIACGTGYWTEVVAEAAMSVNATDIHPELIAATEKRCRRLGNVTCLTADAYSLEGVRSGFTGAFAVWWFSHVPKAQLGAFLSALHDKLAPGAVVLFRDQLRYDHPARRIDENGDTVEQRTLSDGREFEVVKNFPTREDVTAALSGIAEDVQYTERPAERSWEVVYRVKG